MQPWRLMLEGSAEDLALLARLYRDHPGISVEYEDSLYWLIVPALKTESRDEIYAEAERFLGVVRGMMKVYFNSDADVHLKGIYGGLHNGGITLNVARVKGLPDPAAAEFLDSGEDGITHGARTIEVAQQDDALADALSVLGTPTIQWWQIYIALEHLASHYSSASNKGKREDRAFEELERLHGVPKRSIKDLKQTANYHRHASETLPEAPWDLLEAGEFVKKAVRQWVAEHKARFDLNAQSGLAR